MLLSLRQGDVMDYGGSDNDERNGGVITITKIESPDHIGALSLAIKLGYSKTATLPIGISSPTLIVFKYFILFAKVGTWQGWSTLEQKRRATTVWWCEAGCVWA
ncbi:cell wall anchor domain-containing protein [Sesbania bispinosa]|nr:cell wall anchor domain-containing protein [Sesbania bispinosa]